MKSYRNEERSNFRKYASKAAYSYRYIKYKLGKTFYFVAENLPAATVLSAIPIGGYMLTKAFFPNFPLVRWVSNSKVFDHHAFAITVVTGLNTVLVGYVTNLNQQLNKALKPPEGEVTSQSKVNVKEIYDNPNLYAPIMNNFINQTLMFNLELLKMLIALGTSHSEKKLFDAKHDIDYLLASAKDFMKEQEYFSAFRHYRSARLKYRRLYEMQLSRTAISAKLFDIYYWEAKALFLIKKYDNPVEIHAIQVLTELLQIDEHNKDALNLRGIIRFLSGNRDAAIGDFKFSLRLDETQTDIDIFKSYCSNQPRDILKLPDLNYNALCANGIAHLILFFQGKAHFLEAELVKDEKKKKHLIRAFEYFLAAKATVPQNSTYIEEQLTIYKALFETIHALILYPIEETDKETSYQITFKQLVPQLNSVTLKLSDLLEEMSELQIKIDRLLPLKQLREAFLEENEEDSENISEEIIIQFLSKTCFIKFSGCFGKEKISIGMLARKIYDTTKEKVDINTIAKHMIVILTQYSLGNEFDMNEMINQCSEQLRPLEQKNNTMSLT